MKKALKKKTGARKTTNVLARPSRREMQRFEAEDDLHTLQRAEEISADKARMARAQQAAKQKMAALNRVVRGSPKK